MRQQCGDCGGLYNVPNEEEHMVGIWNSCPACKKLMAEWWGAQKEGEHICDYTVEQLKERHKNALALIERYGVQTIGTLLLGRYYLNGFNSRSCSERMAFLVGGVGYMDFYCGSSNYLELCMEGRQIHPTNKELLGEFNEACEKDEAVEVKR
jgi:hypothetical protein